MNITALAQNWGLLYVDILYLNKYKAKVFMYLRWSFHLNPL